MSIQNANNSVAMCQVTLSVHGAGVQPTFVNAVGFNTTATGQSTHTATGVYVLQLDDNFTPGEVYVGLTATAFTTSPTFSYTITQSGTAVPVPGNAAQTYLPTLLTVTTLDAAAAADTVSFSCMVFRTPQTNNT